MAKAQRFEKTFGDFAILVYAVILIGKKEKRIYPIPQPRKLDSNSLFSKHNLITQYQGKVKI